MKITKRQLRQIIKEERARLSEGFKEVEMDLIDLIVDELIQKGAIGTIGNSYEAVPDYADAVDYLRRAVIPHLESLAGGQR
jgi:hypothetical protein